MAVEARHLNLCAPQTLSNRDHMMMNSFVDQGNGNVFYEVAAPFSGKTTPSESLIPIFGDSALVKTPAMKSESGLTCSVPISRKRSRDMINPLLSPFSNVYQNQIANGNSNRCGSLTFLGEDLSVQIQQQQLELDRFIAQHNEKVRIEIEEKRRRFTSTIAAALEQNVMKKLKPKDEQINKIGKLNWALQEKVKSLCVENQIWRDLAQTNEATANALRLNLEQVLNQINDDQQQQHDVNDDAQSCCGSNFGEYVSGGGCIAPTAENNRICRSCGREESCVLLLPCRHLCLCTVCGSTLHTCPVCKSTKTASVHVNLSS